MEIAITVGATIGGGVTVFVIGQIFVVLFLERIRTQARCIEEIAEALVMYAQFYSSPISPKTPKGKLEQIQSASIDIRRLAALLRANAQTLRFYKVWRCLRLVQPKDKVVAASKELILVSNVCPPIGMDQINAGIAASSEALRLLGIDSGLVS